MTWGRALGLLLALWVLGLGIWLQPHDHPGPVITHSRLLDERSNDLPTLGPISP